MTVRKARTGVIAPKWARERTMRNAGTLAKVSLLSIVLVVYAFTGQVLAQVGLDPGDIIVADPTSVRIIEVDPLTGAQAIISSGGVLRHPYGVAIDAAGKIIVGDIGAGVVSVDPATGHQTVISSGGFLSNPIGVALDASGDIIVVNNTSDLIISVDPVTGAQTVISSGGEIDPGVGIAGVAIDASGGIIVPLDKKVVRVHPGTGAQTVISSDGFFFNLEGVAIDAAGNIIVANAGATGTGPRIISVHPETGAQTVISRNPSGPTQGNHFWNPFGVALDAAGAIVVADWSSDKLVRVDPVSGAQTVISSGGFFNDALGVAIVPAPEATNQPPEITVNPNPTPLGGNSQLPAPNGGYNNTGGLNAVSVGVFAIDPDVGDTVTLSNNAPAFLPLGDTLVTWTATDVAGAEVSADQTVTVKDNRPPNITVPFPISQEATLPSGNAITFVMLAADTVDANPTVTCVPASGATFPLGITTVHCTAEDASGNTNPSSFDVTVEDTTPPSLTVPSAVTQEATAPLGNAITFTATATDAADANPRVTCVPDSGDTFALGTTRVDCSAEDASGNTSAPSSFDVTLILGQDTFESAEDTLQDIINSGTPLAGKVEDALGKVQTALEELAKDPPDTQAALGNLEGTVGDLEAALDEGVTQATAVMIQIAGIARALAEEAIGDAIAQGGDPDKVAEAQDALAGGDVLRANETFKDAVHCCPKQDRLSLVTR